MSDINDPSDPSRPKPGAGDPPPADYAAGSEGPSADEAHLRGDYRSRSEQFRQNAEDAAKKARGAAEKAQEHTRVHMESARETISESSDRIVAIAGYLLALAAGFTLGASAVVGAILAWVKADSTDPLYASHIGYLTRTFWIGLAGLVVGLVLTLIWIGWPLLLALAVWWVFRHAVGLIRLLEGKPIRDPKAWLL